MGKPLMKNWTAPEGTEYEVCDETARRMAEGCYFTDRSAVADNVYDMKTSDLQDLFEQLRPGTYLESSPQIAMYEFSTGEYNAEGKRGIVDKDIKKPVILIMAGIHGNEKAGTLSVYKFFKDLCEKKNIPAYIPEGTIFKVVPVVNPNGYDAKKRDNRNLNEANVGVDLNRNFSYNWAPAADTKNNYGTEAESEKETKAIKNWLLDNATADLFIDVHNSGNANEVAMVVGLNDEKTKKAKKIALQGLDRVIPYWKDVLKYSEDSIFSYSSFVDETGGCVYYASQTLGIPSIALELSSMQNGSTEVLSEETIAAGAEALGNILMEAIRRLEE